MKQIDITNKNKDLDLRRFGKGVYSKAEKSGGSDGSGSSEGGSEGGGDNGGSGSNSNTFFQLATIQPNRYLTYPPDSDTITLIDIENLDLNTLSNYLENDKNITFFYSKEEIAKLGVSLEELEALECFTFGNVTPTENNSIPIDNSVITDNFIIKDLEIMYDDAGISNIDVSKVRPRNGFSYFIMRCAYGDNNNYTIISYRAIG